VEPKNPEGTSNVRDSRLFDTIEKILFAYRTSMFYREVNLRSVLFEKETFKLLDHERVYQEIPGVWNLSADQGNLGSFIFTTVRIVWYAENNRMHNVSMPWCQIEVVKISPSKFGVAFVIKSSSSSGKYTLGFRIDPEEKMREIAKQAAQVRSFLTILTKFSSFSKRMSQHLNSVFENEKCARQIYPKELSTKT
jgi:Bardet-Biedl syndrome 5 protein